MSRYIPGLGNFMKSEDFKSIPIELQDSVYKYLQKSRKLKKHQSDLTKLELEYNEKINKLKGTILEVKGDITKFHNQIENLPDGISFSKCYVNIDKKSKSVLVQLEFCGEKKKFSVGSNWKEVNSLFKKVDKNQYSIINSKNYKIKIPELLKLPLNKLLLSHDLQTFKDCMKIKWDNKLKKFTYTYNEGIDMGKNIRRIKNLEDGKNHQTDRKILKSNRLDTSMDENPIPIFQKGTRY
jgi:hypothetical protein